MLTFIPGSSAAGYVELLWVKYLTSDSRRGASLIGWLPTARSPIGPGAF